MIKMEVSSMTISRWRTTGCDPFRVLSTLQEGMNRLFEEMLPTTGKKQEELHEGTFNPEFAVAICCGL